MQSHPIFPRNHCLIGGVAANASRVPPRLRLGRAAFVALTSRSLDPSTLGGWANFCAGTLKHGDIRDILRVTPV